VGTVWLYVGVAASVVTIVGAAIGIWRWLIRRRRAAEQPEEASPQDAQPEFEVEVSNLFETHGPDFGPWSFGVQGINRSDHPVRVTSAGFERGDGKQIVITEQPFGSSLVRTLPPHDSGQTWMECDTLASAGLDVYGPIVGWVRLATGELYRSEPKVLRAP
jgi:hypothetical protein